MADDIDPRKQLRAAGAVMAEQQAEIEQLRLELYRLRQDNRRLADLYEGLYDATKETRSD